jgi:ketosteroid isomerase-like protein
MNTEDKNIALIRRLYEYFNTHDWNAMAALYTEPADFKDPSFGPEIVQQTRKQTAQKYRELAEIFPDIRDDIVAVYPSGEKHVIVEFVSSGTAPNGDKWTLPICTIFTIEEGLITKDFTYYDKS